MVEINYKSLRTPFRIGDWYVEPESGRLQRRDEEVKLEPKAMMVLVCLAQNAGKVVSRETLEATVWAGTIVGYDALSSSIIKLRKALGDNSRNPQYIETISKKGYRLIANVVVDELIESDTVDNSKPKGGQTAQLFRNKVFVLLMAVGVGMIGVIGLWYLFSDESNTPAYETEINKTIVSTSRANVSSDKHSIVVLPFKNLSDDPEQEYFSDGITDDLITDLSKVSGLLVIARRSAYIYKQRTNSITSVAKELGVQYVVEGSVRKGKEKIRLNVQLVDAGTDTTIWAERFDKRITDLFQIQDDIRKKIISALSVKLTEEEKKRIQNKYAASLEAYDYFLQGQASLIKRSSTEENRQAQELLQTAIDIDPGFARAVGALALTHADAFRFDWTDNPEATAKLALELAQRAKAMDNYSPQVHWVLGFIYLFLYEEHKKAIAIGERTLELDPNYADGYILLAATYLYANDYNKAMSLVEKAMQLNPHYPAQYPGLYGQTFLLLGEYAEAKIWLEKSLLINPSLVYNNVYLAILLYRMGKVEEAQWQFDQLLTFHPEFKIRIWADRQPYQDKSVSVKLANDLQACCE